MKRLSRFSVIMLTVMSVTSVILVAISLLDRAGYRLLWSEFNLLGCVAMLVMLMVWGAGNIYRRVKSKNAKTVTGLALGFVVMLVGLVLSTLVMQFGQMALPHRFADIRSPGGKTAVLMRAVDMGGATEESFQAMRDRMDTRKAAIEAETGETSEDYPYGAYGYTYMAYPKMLGIFYNANAQTSGELYRGCESESRILYEWSEDNTLRVYLEDLEPGDEGEIFLYD